MKHALLLLITLILIGCNKIELPEEENVLPEEPDIPVVPTDEEYNSVSEALHSSWNEEYYLQGYIVGYVSGNSIKSGARFCTANDKQTTNILLADRIGETDQKNCIPIKLEKTGKQATRDQLNLYDHPELLKKRIEIKGKLAQYFSRNGIVRIYYYKVSDNEDVNDNYPNTDSIPTPDISDNEELIPEGR